MPPVRKAPWACPACLASPAPTVRRATLARKDRPAHLARRVQLDRQDPPASQAILVLPVCLELPETRAIAVRPDLRAILASMASPVLKARPARRVRKAFQDVKETPASLARVVAKVPRVIKARWVLLARLVPLVVLV